MQRPSHLIASVAAVVLSFAVSCAAYALTDHSARNGATTATVIVNRTSKGDRLPLAPPQMQTSSTPAPAKLIPPKRVPLGCEPAFSPVAEPAGAHIFLRCLS
jgi:hypothetical protein